MIVRREKLPFSLVPTAARVRHRLGTPSEFAGRERRFIVAEMDRPGLRLFSSDSDEVLFDGQRNIADYRLCIVEALNRWQTEISKPRTLESVEQYNRPCGE